MIILPAPTRLSTVASSIATATISQLPTPAGTLVTSAASAVATAPAPSIVVVAIAAILLSSVVNPVPAEEAEVQQADENVEAGDGSRAVEDQASANA